MAEKELQSRFWLMTKSTPNCVEQGYVRPLSGCPGGTVSRRAGFLSTVLLAASSCFGLLILIKVACFFSTWTNAEDVVRKHLASGKPDANDLLEHIAKSRAIADELTKRNLFAPLPPKPHPVKAVAGILGNEVLIEDKWYKVGDTIEDAKIVAIEPTLVRIEWQGKRETFSPIDQSDVAEPGRPGSGNRHMERAATRQEIAAAGAPMAVVRPQERIRSSKSSFGRTPEEKKPKLQVPAQKKQKLPIGNENAKKLLKLSTEKTQAIQKKLGDQQRKRAVADNQKETASKAQNKKPPRK